MISCDAEFVKKEIIDISGYPKEKIVVFAQGIDRKKFNTDVDGSGIRKQLGWEDKKLWRHSSICVNKIRQPPANIRLGHVIKLILNKCNKIPKDLRSFHIRFN